MFVAVENLPQAQKVLEISPGERIDFITPPYAACYMGSWYWSRFLSHLHELFPGREFTLLIDCGVSRGYVLEAIALGFSRLLYRQCDSWIDSLKHNTPLPLIEWYTQYPKDVISAHAFIKQEEANISS